MKQTHFISRLALGTLLVVSAGCSRDLQPDPDPGPRFAVNFSVPAIEGLPEVAPAANAAQTKAALADRTTVRVVAYRVTAGGVCSAAYAGEQTYVADASGVLSPCTVTNQGGYLADAPGDALRLTSGSYQFCAITPALPLGADHTTVSVSHGVDYAASVTDNGGSGIMIDQASASGKSITLTTLQRQCVKIQLVVTRDATATNITAVGIAGSVTLSYLSTAPLYATAGLPLVPTEVPLETSRFWVESDAFTQNDDVTATSTICVLPKVKADMGLSFSLATTIDGTPSTKTVAGKVSDIELKAGGSYLFTLTLTSPGATLTVTDWIDGGTQDNDMGV